MVMSDAAEVALAAARFLTDGGYVLLAGTLTFWLLVWPRGGPANRRMVLLTVAGTALMGLGLVLDPMVQLLDGIPLSDVLPPLGGSALLVRLAALVAVIFFLSDLIDTDTIGWRRLFAGVVVAVLAGSLVVRSDAVDGRWETLKIVAASGHVLATAAWLGGLVALAAVLIPLEDYDEFDRLVPRFSRVADVCVITLVVTGLVQALAVAGGFSGLASYYGLVVLLKVAVLAAMIVLGNEVRLYAVHVAAAAPERAGGGGGPRRGTSAIAAVLGAEAALAAGVLALTAVLVAVAPPP